MKPAVLLRWCESEDPLERILAIAERIPASHHRLTETGLLLLPPLHLVPLLPGEPGEACGAVLVELRRPDGRLTRVNGCILNAVLPFHVRCRVLVAAAMEDDVPAGTTARLLRPGTTPIDRVDRVLPRRMLDDDARQAEAAFDEQTRTGATEVGCPWCGSPLCFKDYGQSGYRIDCTFCDFRLTARGI